MTDRDSPLSRSVLQIARDVESAARTWSRESRQVRDEAMGAELLATREIVEQFGILFESVDRLNDLAVRQTGHLVRDYAATLRQAVTEPGLHNCRDLVLGHWQRRIGHLVEGGDEFAALVRSETAKFGDALFGLWGPFAATLARDWRTGAPRDRGDERGEPDSGRQ